MVCVLSLILIFSLLGFSQGEIDASLMEALTSGKKADVLIDFHGGNTEALLNVRASTFSTRVEKIEALTTELKSLMDRSQGEVLKYLALEEGVQFDSFWSSNQMVVQNADLKLIQTLNNFTQVSRIQKEPVIVLSPVELEVDNEINSNSSHINEDVAWGVAKIEAEKVWALKGNIQGQGLVIANIDTGVRGTHEALQGNYRDKSGDISHSWYDPIEGSKAPKDPQGHGTHTMGTLVGTKGIGVAPQAKWIACRGIRANGEALGRHLLACGKWMIKPTKPDGRTDPQAKFAPHIISNSWGGGPGADNNFFNATIQLWKEAGIVFVFSIGNSGSKAKDKPCKNTGSPGNQPGVFSVGSTDINDRLSDFSSRGPQSGRMKPEISAPGQQIRSAGIANDASYSILDGTSMACPHVAGTIALIQSARLINGKQKLNQEAVVKLIEDTAFKGVPSYKNAPCEADPANNALPNNGYGFGRVNALAAVKKVLSG